MQTFFMEGNRIKTKALPGKVWHYTISGRRYLLS